VPSPWAPAPSRWTSPSAGTRTNRLSLFGISLFGGKGGVGKTTCAAAAALTIAESGRRVLAVSTDPAHSLGDAFDVRLSAEPVPIKTRRRVLRGLLAAELAAGPALGRWREEHRQTLKEIAARGTYLDEEDVERFLDLSLPGADELLAWLELERLVQETGCDEVVVDAAPTAHTLRLLAMPEALSGLARVLDRMQDRHRLLAERFGGVWRPDESDELISDLETQGRRIAERLRDPERSALFWVMLPEALSLAETKDALKTLDEAGIPVREVIVNRVQARDGEVVREIEEAFADRALRFLPEEDQEPRGMVALRRMGKRLREPHPRPGINARARQKSPLKGTPAVGFTRLFSTSPGIYARAEAWLDDIAPENLGLLFLGGKGGVGKTTCAAAIALALAEHHPKARILLLSTDPAHSVADVLEVPLDDDERPIPEAPPGLRARELDATRAFDAWRERHAGKVGEAVEAFTSEGVGDLLDLTPPGLDELIALSTLLDAVIDPAVGGERPYDLVVVDTAPTGHALRLLEMPELALSWDHYLLSLLLKYREAVGLGDLAAELVQLSRSLKRLEALLRDPDRTRFVAVTRAAELPRRETVRLLEALEKLSIAAPAVIVNAVPPERTRRERFGGCAIIEAPAVFPPPRGVRRLAEWVRTWEKATE
jgi:arsenite-transporting ATPase